MRIDPATALQSALIGLLKGNGRGGDGLATFRPEVPAGAASPVPAGTAPTATSTVAMLVAMSAQAPGLHRAPALRRAERGLEALGRLHRSLMAGALPDEALQALREWTSERVDTEDEDVSALLRDVQLRILVELAKAGR